MSLTALQIRAFSPGATAYKRADERGLYLEIFPNGSKLWRLKYYVGGKEKRIALGAWPEVSLQAARLERDELRLRIAKGEDPAFADMFAQTICYGMLAAAISRPSGALVADNMADMVPRTNPFLKELFANFLKLGGRDKRSNLDFDELGVREVVDMLQRADMPAVLRDFGDRNPKEDPVIHFYELFLKEYDPAKRMQRGVFYTPRPVVNFIVRGVDEILRTEFDLRLGLADTTTWGELAARNDKITVPDHIDPDQPFVQILDPATGTGTFLVEVIDLIHKRMVEHWQGEDKSKVEIAEAWNAYVPAHLLPRLTAFELMMAPYAIAHMKVGLKLTETGYMFGSEERARVFLTNALEPRRDLDLEERMNSQALAHEADQANQAKERVPVTVVVGNPPYSVKSFNMGPWITQICEIYKENVRQQESQIQALSNDYIKFIRLGQYYIDRSRLGVMSLITGHGYMLGTQPRDMRKALYQTFGQIRAINLNGSVRRNDVDGVDEPVFEIMTGVGIGVFTKGARENDACATYESWEGSFDSKMDRLLANSIGDISAPSVRGAKPNFYFWTAGDLESEYQSYVEIPQFFGTGNRAKDKEIYWATGYSSRHDGFAISFSADDVSVKLRNLANAENFEQIDDLYGVCSTKHWNFDEAKKFAKVAGSEIIDKVYYRPFDHRFSILNENVIAELREKVMSNFEGMTNLALVSSRAVNDLEYGHVLASEMPVDKIFLSSKTSTNAYFFPVWLKQPG